MSNFVKPESTSIQFLMGGQLAAVADRVERWNEAIQGTDIDVAVMGKIGNVRDFRFEGYELTFDLIVSHRFFEDVLVSYEDSLGTAMQLKATVVRTVFYADLQSLEDTYKKCTVSWTRGMSGSDPYRISMTARTGEKKKTRLF